MNDNFIDIIGFPGYKINTKGDIFSIKLNKLIKPFLSKNYLKIKLTKDKKRYSKFLHRLVFENFKNADYDKNLVINHKDGDTINCFLDNLECITQKENIKHSKTVTKNGTVISRKKILEIYNKNKFSNVEDFLNEILLNVR